MNGILSWLGQNGTFAMALLAMVGTVATAFFGWRSRLSVSGDREADQEEEIRGELRTENKDLKAEVKELETQNATLKQLLAEEKEHTRVLQKQNQDLQQQISRMTEEQKTDKARIKRLEADVMRLTSDITDLKAKQAGV